MAILRGIRTRAGAPGLRAAGAEALTDDREERDAYLAAADTETDPPHARELPAGAPGPAGPASRSRARGGGGAARGAGGAVPGPRAGRRSRERRSGPALRGLRARGSRAGRGAGGP